MKKSYLISILFFITPLSGCMEVTDFFSLIADAILLTLVIIGASISFIGDYSYRMDRCNQKDIELAANAKALEEREKNRIDKHKIWKIDFEKKQQKIIKRQKELGIYDEKDCQGKTYTQKISTKKKRRKTPEERKIALQKNREKIRGYIN
jgi:hypothetical protein